MGLFSRPVGAAGSAVLGAPLALLLVLAASSARDRWPGLVGDEATYLMQAESLAWDGDLRFDPEDLRRFRERHGHSPEVILHSGDGGARIVYGKPFLYALAIAPFVRVLGERGAVLLNVGALAAAGWVAALALRRRGSAAAPLWISVALFGSIAFAHVFWIHPDLFLMAACACGLAIARLLRAASVRGPRQGLAHVLAWCAAGALLAIPAVWRPPYALLLVPGLYLAASAEPARAGGRSRQPGRGAPAGAQAPRRTRVVAVLAGAAAVAALTVGGQVLASGSWSPYAGERRGFSELEGFPGVDFPASDWSRQVLARGNTSWLDEGSIAPVSSPELAVWNLAYLLVGRTVGLVPYFLPAMVALFGRGGGRASRIEAMIGLAIPLAFLVLRPWNFYGGAGALANRYFLPAYPLFWFGGVGAARSIAALVAAAPFLVSTWGAPAAYPVVAGEGYRYVSATARRLLPVETTQRHVKAPGRSDVVHGQLWVRFLDGGTAPVGDGAERLELRAGRAAEILVGRTSPIDVLTIERLGGDAVTLRASGGGARAAVQGTPPMAGAPAPSGPAAGAASTGAVPDAATTPALLLAPERPTARHSMWWTDEPFFLYRLTLEAEAPSGVDRVELRLVASAPAEPSSTIDRASEERAR